MPQNMKTSPQTEDEDKLPMLSVEEEKLVEALVNGDDNCEAYRKAYGAAGYSAASLRVRACRKVAEAKIQQHLRAIRSVGLANLKLTLEARIEAEAAFAARAEAAGNFGAAGQAYDRMNKLCGHYVDKHMDVTKEKDPVQAVMELAEATGADPHVLAAKYRVKLPDAGATKH